MVMEAPPSPQSVGREFVRQYYTLLNKAPTHLHRFYNQNSSFVHGGLDPPNRETSPVVGQKQIHQKIQQLNFLDCHAKITQVDSQATLGNGVVVQVTGELSNAGQPMRRFTQTFVLASQSPKKFYVHNDIFRYQDEIISDEECDVETRSEPEEDINQECPPISDVQAISQQPIPFYPNTANLQPNILPPVHHTQPPPHVLPPQPVPTVNGAVHPEDINVVPGHITTHIPTGQGLGNPMVTAQPGLVPANMAPMVIEEDTQTLEEPVEENIENTYNMEPQEPEIIEHQEMAIEHANNEPKTYANLVKSGSNTAYGSPQQMPPLQMMTRPLSPTQPSSLGGQPGLNQRNNMNRGPRISNTQSNQPRIPRQESGRVSSGRNLDDDDRRRTQSNSFGDINQLFLGNLPHSATEDELRDIFVQFGNILDLRVHSKQPNKTGPTGGRAPANYGFITYENQQGVSNCLAAKPIYYPKDDKSGTLLNVEEKKVKDRSSFGGGRPNNDNNRTRDNNGPRRGPGGLGGPNRNNSGNGGNPTGGPGGVRNNSYNRGGGPPNRGGSNNYNRR